MADDVEAAGVARVVKVAARCTGLLRNWSPGAAREAGRVIEAAMERRAAVVREKPVVENVVTMENGGGDGNAGGGRGGRLERGRGHRGWAIVAIRDGGALASAVAVAGEQSTRSTQTTGDATERDLCRDGNDHLLLQMAQQGNEHRDDSELRRRDESRRPAWMKLAGIGRDDRRVQEARGGEVGEDDVDVGAGAASGSGERSGGSESSAASAPSWSRSGRSGGNPNAKVRTGSAGRGGLLAGALSSIERSVFLLTHPPVRDRLELAAGTLRADPLHRCGRCARLLGERPGQDGVCDDCRESPPSWMTTVTLGTYTGALREVVLSIKERPWPELAGDAGFELGLVVRRRLRSMGMVRPLVILIPSPTSRWRVMRRGIDHPLEIAKGVARGLRRSPAASGMSRGFGWLGLWGGGSRGGDLGGVHAGQGIKMECEVRVVSLLRRAWRPRQAGMAAWRRSENLEGTMGSDWLAGLPRVGAAARLGQRIAQARQEDKDGGDGREVVAVVVDDVMTTGATATETVRAARSTMKNAGFGVKTWIVACLARTEVASG